MGQGQNRVWGRAAPRRTPKGRRRGRWVPPKGQGCWGASAVLPRTLLLPRLPDAEDRRGLGQTGLGGTPELPWLTTPELLGQRRPQSPAQGGRARRLHADGARTSDVPEPGNRCVPAAATVPCRQRRSCHHPPLPAPPRHDPQDRVCPCQRRVPGREGPGSRPLRGTARPAVPTTETGLRGDGSVAGSRVWERLLAFKLVMRRIPPAQSGPSLMVMYEPGGD